MGRDGILSHWLNVGASGWRLDVADELPDGFLEQLRKTVKATDADALVLGEVWEDASNKRSYGHRRRYLLGEQLDSVMNYPFRTAILDFMRGGDAKKFFDRVGDIMENYPPPVTRLLMNFLGTHDTERVLTVLAGEPANGRGRRWQSVTVMSEAQRELAKRRLMAAAVLQYGLPGVPCIYYGDEVGMEGYRDPFNRGCFPWGGEDEVLQSWFEALGNVRASYDVFAEGTFEPIAEKESVVVFDRSSRQNRIRFAVNRSDIEQHILLDGEWHVLVGEGVIEQDCLCLPPVSGCILLKA
jgi:glycosidase